MVCVLLCLHDWALLCCVFRQSDDGLLENLSHTRTPDEHLAASSLPSQCCKAETSLRQDGAAGRRVRKEHTATGVIRLPRVIGLLHEGAAHCGLAVSVTFRKRTALPGRALLRLSVPASPHPP